MTGSRNKYAWIWVAVTAISLASVSRTAARIDGARANANPVLHFLVKSHSTSVVAKSSPGMRLAQRRSIFRDAQSGTWIAFLPVYFVGLLTLSSLSAPSVRALVPLPAAPPSATAFQRPPPVFA
jgi:hypothetical protein